MHHALSNSCTLLVSAVFVAAAASAAPVEPVTAPIGCMSAGAGSQHALEQKFDAQLQASDQQAWMKQMSAKPNSVGMPQDKANAEFVQQQFRAWGWDAQIETFDVLYPTLKQHSLELVAPTHFVATLKEPPVDGDSTSTQTDGL